MKVSHDQPVEMRMADALWCALEAFSWTEEYLTLAEVLDGAGEFFFRVCTMLFLKERAQGHERPFAEIVQVMDGYAGRVAVEVTERLQAHWTP